MKMKRNILKLDSNAKYTNNNSLTKSINRNVALLNDLETKNMYWNDNKTTNTNLVPLQTVANTLTIGILAKLCFTLR